MANVGLGYLAELKAQLLSADLTSRTTWDARITAIGRGVAREFDKFCNRKFERASGTTDTFHAERAVWILERYPVESVSAVDLRDNLTTGWVSAGSVADAIQTWDAQSGLVMFPSRPATYISECRITYTGGYWFDTDESGGTTQPAGTTLLPYDVKEAWFIQCKKVWEVYDPLGTKIAESGNAGNLLGLSLAGLELVPEVKTLLQGHIRMNFS